MSDLFEFTHLQPKNDVPERKLDTFPKPKHVMSVRFYCAELTSFCPVTNQPDFNEVTIEYEPRQLCIETKSLKLYLWSFREERIFAEQLAARIAEDIAAAADARHVRVTLTQNVRGGIETTVEAEILRYD